MRLLCLVCVCLPVLSAHALDTQAALLNALALYNEHGHTRVPVLDDQSMQTLLSGEPLVLTQVRDEDGEKIDSMGITALKLVEQPRDLVWLSLFGGSGERNKRYSSVDLTSGPDGSYTRYQHLDLPFPFRDRHWVIGVNKNIGLAELSGGQLWEHYWTLADEGEQLLVAAESSDTQLPVDVRARARSIYLPANRGAWIAADLGDGKTLVIARMDADFGGFMPKGLVKRFTRSRLTRGLLAIAARAPLALERYTGEPVVIDGFGQPIAPERVRETTLAIREKKQIEATRDR